MNAPIEKTLDKVESFIKQHEKDFPTDILTYFAEVIKQDREYLKMVKQWSDQQKKVLKPKTV